MLQFENGQLLTKRRCFQTELIPRYEESRMDAIIANPNVPIAPISSSTACDAKRGCVQTFLMLFGF
jgi:hypothetical protein